MTERVVFDCVVFVQGASRPSSPARGCIALVDQGAVELCLSDAILAEVSDVLGRPKTRKRFPILTDAGVEEFLTTLRARATAFSTVPEVFAYPRDPDDEPYVNLALAAGAPYLVTWDNDLLDLMNEFLPEGQDFRQRFPHLSILTPPAFLAVIRGKQQTESPPTT